MPAVQYDYDYYEYGRSRRSSANAVTSNGASRKSSQTVRKASTKPKTQSQQARRSTSQKIEVKTSTTRSVTRAATRAVTRDVSTTTQRRKNTSKNLEVPSMVSRRQIQKPKEMSLKRAEVVTSKNINQKKSTPLRDVAVSFFAFSILFLICYRSSLINESFSELNGMKNRLGNINTKNAQIESEIQTQTDLSNIESYAKYQLGMQKPKDSQIQKVVIDKEDKIATPVVIEEEEETFWKKLMNDIRNILD